MRERGKSLNISLRRRLSRKKGDSDSETLRMRLQVNRVPTKSKRFCGIKERQSIKRSRILQKYGKSKDLPQRGDPSEIRTPDTLIKSYQLYFLKFRINALKSSILAYLMFLKTLVKSH